MHFVLLLRKQDDLGNKHAQGCQKGVGHAPHACAVDEVAVSIIIIVGIVGVDERASEQEDAQQGDE